MVNVANMQTQQLSIVEMDDATNNDGLRCFAQTLFSTKGQVLGATGNGQQHWHICLNRMVKVQG
ncbi:MAG: hypothetical protein ACKPKO_08645, partial [Candidatus Fonsibacter sp.]